MENTYIFESQKEMAKFNTIQDPATAETYFSHPPLLALDIYAEVPETFLYPDSSLLPQMLSNSFSTYSNSPRETQANSSEQELAHLPRIVESRRRRPNTTQTDRVKIMAALSLGHSVSEIVRTFGYSHSQIYNVQKNGTKLRQKNCGRKPAISPEKSEELKNWLLSDPRNRFVPFVQIPRLAPELDLGHHGVKAIRRAFKSQGYGRWISKRKGFSDTPEYRQRSLEFAVAAIQWTPERLSQQIFSDEVWPHGGANTWRSVTVLVAGDRQDMVFDRFRLEYLTPKFSRLPAWMFHGVIYNGRKALGMFWEKEYGTMNSAKYDAYILSYVQSLVQYERSQGRNPWYQHDNASCHRSWLTEDNLRFREIKTIGWPPYSPDLNLLEPVWAKMKKFIRDHYTLTGYEPRRVGIDDLRRIIQEAWDAVPDEFVSDLYASWRDRCKAVIDAGGGPTKH